MNTFTKEHVVPELKSNAALPAIDELVDHLASVGAISADAKAQIASAIKKREQSMSTGIGFGVALPHATTPLVDEIIMAFGRSANGIEFEALDQVPVRLVMLVIVPEREREKHLPTLARISRFFHRKEIRSALEAAREADAIASILNTNAPAPA